MKVSIIVPVYNTSKYLDKCLNSLVNQTLADIEIIIINDGSTDNSVDIINRYKKDFSNIVLINKRNCGVSAARNDGIRIAKGKYIGFVDSDDYIATNMYEKMYKTSIINNSDVVVCDLYEINAHRIKKMSSGLNKNLGSKNQIRANMNNINSTLCNKIYKTSILKNNLFTVNMEYEDVEFLYKLFPKLNNISYVDSALYYYNVRDDSKTHTYSDTWYKLLDNLDIIINYYKDNDLYNIYKNEIEYMYIKYSLGTFLKKTSKYSDITKFNEAYKTAFNKLNILFPTYKSNKYLHRINIRNLYFLYIDKISTKKIYKYLRKYM